MRSVTTVKASKCICDRSSALDPLRELTALPQTPELDMRGGKGLQKGNGAKGKKGREREGMEGKVKAHPNKTSGYGLGPFCSAFIT